MTYLERAILIRLSDGASRTGHDLHLANHAPLIRLLHKDCVTIAGKSVHPMEDEWTITPEGLRARAVAA